jgi:hypothetical protein
MTPFPPRFQILSDLHLETPLTTPSYTPFTANSSLLTLHASNLLLLGDIGYVRDERLFVFLRSLLQRTPNLRVFYLLGNHEAYGLTLCQARNRLREFEADIRAEYGERFFFMDKRRVDISPGLTVLGTTLWSRISEARREACERVLTDFKEEGGIRGRGVEEHNKDFEGEVGWLNGEVGRIEEENRMVDMSGDRDGDGRIEGQDGAGGVKRQRQRQKQILILTHHCPTLDPRARDPRHAGSEVNEGFVSDLRGQKCWESEFVRCWAFGHTHWSCALYDDQSGKEEYGDGDGDGDGQGIGRKQGKLVVSNQRGYAGLEQDRRMEAVRSCVVEMGEDGVWRAVDCEEAVFGVGDRSKQIGKSEGKGSDDIGADRAKKMDRKDKGNSRWKHALNIVAKKIRGG